MTAAAAAARMAAAFAGINPLFAAYFLKGLSTGCALWAWSLRRNERKGSRVASEVQAEATTWEDEAETPPAIPYLEAKSVTDVHLPGPGPESSPDHSPQSLVRALTGRTLVLRWTVDDSLHDVMCGVSERTGVPHHAFNLTVHGKRLTQEALRGMGDLIRCLWSRTASFVVGPRCGEHGCVINATLVDAGRLNGDARPAVPQDNSGSGNSRRENQYPGKGTKHKPAPVNDTYRALRVVYPKKSAPAAPAAPACSPSELSWPAALVAALRTLGISEELLAQSLASFQRPPAQKTERKEQRMLQSCENQVIVQRMKMV